MSGPRTIDVRLEVLDAEEALRIAVPSRPLSLVSGASTANRWPSEGSTSYGQ